MASILPSRRAMRLEKEPAGSAAFERGWRAALAYVLRREHLRRTVRIALVSTIDGVVAIPALRRSNRLISDDSEPDRFVVGLLRACADVVLGRIGNASRVAERSLAGTRGFPSGAQGEC